MDLEALEVQGRLFVRAVAAWIGLATAQNSQVRAASAKSGPDPLQAATKHCKSSGAVPNSATSLRNTTAKLTRLERQNIKAGSSKSGSTGPAKGASVKSADDTSAGSGSEINFKYQKPRVTKEN